jgi:glycosyltransferase involved in cell wall biosynthesis
MKKIWIVAPFSNIDVVGVRNRFQYLSNTLHNEEIDVTLFTSTFSHKLKKHVSNEVAENYPYRVKLVVEPGYKKNVSITRVLSHINFAVNLKKIIMPMEKPDVIYAAYPTMSASYVVGKYAKEHNIPYVIDIQDTWPESISSAIDIKKPHVRFLMCPITKFANKIYRMADVVFAVSDTYAKRAKVKGTQCKEFIPVYIGTELDKFDQISSDEVEKNQNDIWITYIGTLSHSYDIETAIRAFSELKEYGNIKLNILGTGPDEERLIEISKELNTYNINVYFYGYIEYKKMIAVLKKSDIALNAIKSSAKQTITNKLGDYVAAALPILNSCQETEVIDLVINKNLGYNYMPGNVDSLKSAIIDMLNSKKDMNIYSKNARAFAEQCFDRKVSYRVIVDKLKTL